VGNVTDPDTLPVLDDSIPIAAGPTGFTQTGDPDELGATCSTCDNTTTTPIVLAPGDVYVNADFGYQDTAGGTAVRDVSGTVYLDADVDGNNAAVAPRMTVLLMVWKSSMDYWTWMVTELSKPMAMTTVTSMAFR
jgi:hypothetical protein